MWLWTVNDQKSGQKYTCKMAYFLRETSDGKNGHRMKLPVKTATRYIKFGKRFGRNATRHQLGFKAISKFCLEQVS